MIMDKATTDSTNKGGGGANPHSKKAKLSECDAELAFARVRSYLLKCPDVAPTHPAVQAALSGLDQEIQRRQRDAKLQQKFARTIGSVPSDVNNKNTNNNVTKGESSSMNDSFIAVDASTAAQESSVAASAMNRDSRKDEEEMSDDWHEVPESDEMSSTLQPKDRASDSASVEPMSSFLGKQLAKQAVSLIARHSLKVDSQVAAIAAVLHAALKSDSLGFACTGVPEEGPATGFAPPVRELPPSQFLPANWDKLKDQIKLRYRKNGTGAVVLKVMTKEDSLHNDVLDVSMVPASASEPIFESISFAVEDHLNLESWTRAQKEGGKISPTLHYKSLSILLSNFASVFDLGNVNEDPITVDGVSPAAAQQDSLPYVDSSIQNIPLSTKVVVNTPRDPLQVPSRRFRLQDPPGGMRVPTRMEEAFPTFHSNHGDFSGDLLPGGGGGLGPSPPGMGGNLMGPNHPAFHGGGGGGLSGVGPNSGFGMQPRFDPFGPPGGPTDIDGMGIPNSQGRPNGGRGGTGNPNPDHLRPPNSFNNNNMFM